MSTPWCQHLCSVQESSPETIEQRTSFKFVDDQLRRFHGRIAEALIDVAFLKFSESVTFANVIAACVRMSV